MSSTSTEEIATKEALAWFLDQQVEAASIYRMPLYEAEIARQSVCIYRIVSGSRSTAAPQRKPVARASFAKAQSHWRLYYVEAQTHWVRYSPAPTHRHLLDALTEVDKDTYGWFGMEKARKAAIRSYKIATARWFIDQESLALCTNCENGIADAECQGCSGTGVGGIREVKEDTLGTCSDLRPTCSTCAGTGVFRAIRMRLTRECEPCRGSGEIKAVCAFCKGILIVSGAGEGAHLPSDLISTILQLLKKH
jgi:hypothetical protein